MDGREHDVTPLPPQRPYHHNRLHAAEHDAAEARNYLLAVRFVEAQAGDENAQAFFFEALDCQEAAVLIFLQRQAERSNEAACLLLRGYYVSLLLDIRAGNKRAGVRLRRRILAQDRIAYTLLSEFIDRGD